MKPIGRFLSVYKLRYGTPRQGGVSELARGQLILRPDIPACALEGIHEYSHLWLIFKFNFNENKSIKPKVHPPRLLGTSVGLFATRTPHRYNPIGLSRVKLDRVDYTTKTLYLSGIDLLEGTEILDVKPYHPADSLPDPSIPTWMQEAPHHPLEVHWSTSALQELEKALPKLEFYHTVLEVQEAVAQSLAGDPRPDYVRKRCAHEEIYGFRFDCLNVLFHTEGTPTEATRARIVEVQVVSAADSVVDDYKSDSDGSVRGRDESPVRFVMNQQPKPGSREGSPSRLASLHEIAASLPDENTSSSASTDNPKPVSGKLTEKEKLKLHLEKSAGHMRYRNAKTANVKAERLQQGAVTPEQMDQAQRVIEALASSEFEYPKGSEEHESFKNFRNTCLRWLKPGKTVNRREVIQERKLIDQEALEATGIRNLRNQKKKYLAFSHGAVMLQDQTKFGPNTKSVGVTDVSEQNGVVEDHNTNDKTNNEDNEQEINNLNGEHTNNEENSKRQTDAESNINEDQNISANSNRDEPKQAQPPATTEPSHSEKPESDDMFSSWVDESEEVVDGNSKSRSHSPKQVEKENNNSSSGVRGQTESTPRRSYQTQASCRPAEEGSSDGQSNGNESKNSTDNINDDNAASSTQPKYLSQSISCYVCKMHFVILHHFYDRMCPTCAALNMEKRSQTSDLTGKIALVTGGRIKIGYEVVLILLRAGARVITTTRFPRDAVLRFAKEKDFNVWRGRLTVYALDLRVLPALECFVHHLNTTLPRLDILINNAAQTIRRPPAFYRHLMPLERAPLNQLTAQEGVLEMIQDFEPLSRLPSITSLPEPPSSIPASSSSSAAAAVSSSSSSSSDVSASSSSSQVSECVDTLSAPGTGVLSTLSVMGSGLSAAELSQVAILPEDLNADPKHFPSDEFDFNGQQMDLRHSNTWVLPLDQVSSAEAAEVHIINALAPFILNSKLKALMCKSGDPGFIINVSSMEGRFASYKEPVHPHTNMAKAALNMMTCTSAKDYAFSKIYMNSVDTGWVTEENPEPLARRKNGFGPPLDEIDGAARILDPIFTALLKDRYEFGRFYKDYKHSRWEFAHHDS